MDSFGFPTLIYVALLCRGQFFSLLILCRFILDIIKNNSAQEYRAEELGSGHK